MRTEGELQVIREVAAANRHLTRRELVVRLLACAGAGAAWPVIADSHPIFAFLTNDAVLDEAEKLGAADWKPIFLNAQQDESLIALAETVVPGSTAAQANRFIDLLLRVSTDKHKTEFLAALAAFEVEARVRFAKNFSALDENQRGQLLTDASAPIAKEISGSADTGGKRATLHKHFENLKGWVSGAYYSSEMGMRELGWTEDRVFASFPGCEHPEGHH